MGNCCASCCETTDDNYERPQSSLGVRETVLPVKNKFSNKINKFNFFMLNL